MKASEMTNEEIETRAQIVEDCDIVGQDAEIVAVLRDYVRLRGTIKAVEEAIVGFDDYEYKQIKRLLAEAKEGETK